MSHGSSRWGSSYYRYSARPTAAEAGEALRASPDDLAHWQDYCAVMGDAPDLDLLRESMARVRGWPEAQRIDAALSILDMLGFSRRAPLERIRTVFDKVAKPWMEWAFDHGLHDMGLHIEGRIYNDYIKTVETEAHARSTYDELLPSIVRAATARRRVALQSPPGGPAAGPARIGYFLHAPSTLAHVETLLRLVETLRARPAPLFEPIVYIYQGADEGFDARIRPLGVPVVHLDRCPGAESPYQVVTRFEALRTHLREAGVRTLVWMSALPWLAFAATMGLGVKLAWYSMKYHVLRIPGIDAYLTNGDGGMREIRGHPWQTIRLSGRWFDPAFSGEARRGREELGAHRLTMGTIGREEKMTNPRFVEAVARLLRDYRDILYVWCGRRQPREILDIFAKYDVLDRQRFLGWVDTRVVSQMIDIYLDSFPAPSGFTARESMASGAATVFFRSTEAEETGPNGFIRRLLSGEGPAEDVSRARAIMRPRGESLFLLAETPEEYESHARRLVVDEAFRAQVGAANRAWIAAFYEDDAGMLQSHARAVLAV